jgi:hypothetical protein
MDYSDPQHHLSSMKTILEKLFQEGEFAHLYRHRDLCYLWAQVCPDKYLDFTRMKGFYRGVLTIEVSSSAVLQEISQFHQTQILEKLTQLKGGSVRRLVFKLGKFTLDPKTQEP